jgi:hypothetical protein
MAPDIRIAAAVAGIILPHPAWLSEQVIACALFCAGQIRTVRPLTKDKIRVRN